MLKELRNTPVLRHLLVLLYACGVFFFQNFHPHGSGIIFKDFQLRDSKITLRESKASKFGGECAACQLHFAGKHLPSTIFQLDYVAEAPLSICTSGDVFAGKQQSIFNFFLRGPPEWV